MMTPSSLSLTSPTGRKVVFVLIVVQLFVIGVVYYSRVSLWQAFGEDIVPTESPITDLSPLPLNIAQAPVKHDITASAVPATSAHVHMEGSFQQEPAQPKAGFTKIAVGLGITTRGLRDFNGAAMQTKMPFFRSLLKSFCATCSPEYDYNFFLAYDYNDPFMSKGSFMSDFASQFASFVQTNCPAKSLYSLHFVRCDHTKKPAWAQNDAMMEAYVAGMEYFYRINDDTIMKTASWTQAFINTLNKMSPPNVGVVGPKHKGGNENILTYDFVHRTHVDIHGFYYPRYFTDWYGDKWITDVYKPGRSVKLPMVLLMHTMETGQRYKNVFLSGHDVQNQVIKDQQSVTRYVISKEAQPTPADPRKVISLSVDSLAPDHLWGVIRNVQLAPVLFPGWAVRVYTAGPQSDHPVPDRVVALLKSLGASVHFVDTTAVPAAAANYLVADDPEVDVFLVRNPTARLNERDVAAVQDWLAKADQTKCVHSIKDHQKQANLNIVSGQWGALTKHLRPLLGADSMHSFLSGYYKQTGINDTSLAQTFLERVLWDRIKTSVYCHNSVSCTIEVPGVVVPFPFVAKSRIFVGQQYRAYEVVQFPEEASAAVLSRSPQCETAAR